jgi:hypothetical protein
MQSEAENKNISLQTIIMVIAKKKLLLLERLYKDLNSPAVFTSVTPLLAEAHKHGGVGKSIKRNEVEEYLAGQRTYTLHRQARRRYTHLPTLAPGLHTEWQADLSIFDRLSAHNRGFKYLLVCIDTLSRQLFVEPVKSKRSEDMISAFENVFTRSKYVPWKLLTDQGLEFTAKKVQEYFKGKDMEHFSMLTSPRFHAGMAERANRTIKERLYRYFTERRTQRWIDVIQDIARAINHSQNSSIGGMRPVDVTFENAERVRQQVEESARAKRPRRPAKFHVGDHVRIEKHKHVFQKGYTGRFTDEIFTVAEVHTERSPVVYRIQDEDGELIKGWFYTSDLCRVHKSAEEHSRQLHDIDRIIRKQRRDGADYVYVKWKGFGPRYNSWIPASSVTYKNI